MLPSRKPVLRTPVLRERSVYLITGKAKNEAKAEAMAEAKAEAKAEAVKAKAEAKWSSTEASVGSRGLGPS
jgi:6-phosphogluconolactonase/glucosamine-6-phosphate isomerase/deaminase